MWTMWKNVNNVKNMNNYHREGEHNVFLLCLWYVIEAVKKWHSNILGISFQQNLTYGWKKLMWGMVQTLDGPRQQRAEDQERLGRLRTRMHPEHDLIYSYAIYSYAPWTWFNIVWRIYVRHCCSRALFYHFLITTTCSKMCSDQDFETNYVFSLFLFPKRCSDMFVEPSHRRSSCARPWREQRGGRDRPATHLINRRRQLAQYLDLHTPIPYICHGHHWRCPYDFRSQV